VPEEAATLQRREERRFLPDGVGIDARGAASARPELEYSERVVRICLTTIDQEEIMRKLAAAVSAFVLAALVLVAAPPAAAAEQTWKDVTVIDKMCFAKMKDTPEKHTKECLMKCESSGYGVITTDGKGKKFVKFDSKGNELTVEALKAAKNTEGLKATVVGEMSDGTIKVKSITFD
jgi:hypothetical protein